jgi:hypothetical protein
MGDSDSRLGLLGASGLRVPATVDLEEELDLVTAVDRLEVGGLLFFAQLVAYGLLTDLPATVQVGVAASLVLGADLALRKLPAE